MWGLSPLGEAGNDYFDGGMGTDYMFLGAGGNDQVFVQAGSGVKVVNDFEAGKGASHYFNLFGTYFSSLADVQAHMYDYSSFTVIALDPTTVIWVIGVTPGQFTAADFIFNTSAA